MKTSLRADPSPMPRLLSNPGLRLPLKVLLCASSVNVGLLALRICVTRHWHQLYLVWNLFLARLPLIFSIIACELYSRPSAVRRSRWGLVSAGFAWLLFFPNAPYIFTDLVHLGAWHSRHFWIDLVLILLFAWTGFLAGFVSLFLMQNLFKESLGKVAGWLLIPFVAGLSGLAIWLGRFWRWNSWDIFLNPGGIIQDLAEAI